MSQTISVIYIVALYLFGLSCEDSDYEVPPAIVKPLDPHGLQVSIPDYPGIRLFAFHGNVNEEFEHGREAGQMAVDVLRKKPNGRWTYTNRNIKLKRGDIIYYWLYVIKDGLGYERLFQSYEVKEFYKEEEDIVTSTSPSTPSVTPCTTPKPNSSSASRPTTDDDSIIFPTNTPPKVTTDNFDIDIRNPAPKDCEKSITTVNGVQMCSGYLVFDSNFSNGIGRNWTNEVHFNDDESEFVVFDNNQSNSYSESNMLTIKPTLLDDHYGEGFTFTGSLNLTSKCTSQEDLCEKMSKGFSIMPPIMSARLTTDASFSFKYGVLEIKAKLPRGDWVIPEIWLQPKRHTYGIANAGKVIVAKSIGNALLTSEGEQVGSILLTSGLEVNENNRTFKKIKDSGLWSDDFHVFKLEWTERKLTFYVDGQEMGNWDGENPQFLKGHGPLSPFDQEYFIVLGIHVGGYKDIPDEALSSDRPKPWKNNQVKRLKNFYEDIKNWHASWSEKTKLQVDYIRVWAI